MTWKVWISSKEKEADALVKTLQDAGISSERRDIEVADLAFVLNERIYVQAEIKKQPDLLASITQDCRYHEQSASMAESRVPWQFYLVQGYKWTGAFVNCEDELKMEHAMTRVQLSGPLPHNTDQRAHIAFVPLTTPNSLVKWIEYVYRNLVSSPETIEGVMAPLASHVKHHHANKGGTRKQDNVYVQQLARFTGVSDTKAAHIARLFPSWKAFVSFLETAPTLKDVVHGLKGTGIGTKLAKTIYEQTLHSSERLF